MLFYGIALIIKTKVMRRPCGDSMCLFPCFVKGWGALRIKDMGGCLCVREFGIIFPYFLSDTQYLKNKNPVNPQLFVQLRIYRIFVF